MIAVTSGIDGANTHLRPLEERDLEMVRVWRNAARESFIDSREISAEGQRAWFGAYSSRDDDRMFVIEDMSGTPVGVIALYDIDTREGIAEFGRIIIGDAASRGRGLARDAAEALIGHARDALGLSALRLAVLSDNVRARELYTSLGFALEPDGDTDVTGPDGRTVSVMEMRLDLRGGRDG